MKPFADFIAAGKSRASAWLDRVRTQCEGDERRPVKILAAWLNRFRQPHGGETDAAPDISDTGMDKVVTRTPSRRYWLYVAATVSAAGIAMWLLLSPGGSVYRVPADRITIGTVTEGPFEDYAAVRGTVAPLVTMYLTTEQGGTVKEVPVEDGAIVKAGQPIAILANPTVQLQFTTQEVDTSRQIAEVQNTQLQIEQSRFGSEKEILEIEYQINALKADLERDKRLFAAGALARATFDKDQDKFVYEEKLRRASIASFRKAKAIRDKQLAQLQETLMQLKANLAAAQANLDALTIRAPMDGQLTARDAEVGQSKPAGAVLGQVDSRDRFKLTAQVDEFYLGRVLPGQDALMILDGHSYRAKVSKIYPQVANGTFKADFAFIGKAPSGVHTGQAVDLKLELGGAKKALLLPNGQFYQDTGGAWAFVLPANGRTATRHPIRLGRRNPDYIEVLDGLKPGDRVIVSGYEAFKTVARVKVESPSNDN
jgi:HlyD family secretion protein